jgi:hypothetical protein
MILASHGILASSIGQFDADAVAFFNRVTTAGGTLSLTERNAVNTLVIQMKTDGIWTKMKAIYPMVGASAAACAQNLKSSSFTGSFTIGWTFASTGADPNGSSTYMNTGITYTSAESIDYAIGGYIRTNAGGSFASISAGQQTTTSQGIYLAGKWTGAGNISFTRIGGTGADISGTANQAAGFFQSSRTANNSLSFRRNTSSLGTNTTTVTSNSMNSAIFLGAESRNGSLASSTSIPDEIAFAYYSSGLSDLEMDNYYTAVQAFQTTLSRNV